MILSGLSRQFWQSVTSEGLSCYWSQIDRVSEVKQRIWEKFRSKASQAEKNCFDCLSIISPFWYEGSLSISRRKKIGFHNTDEKAKNTNFESVKTFEISCGESDGKRRAKNWRAKTSLTSAPTEKENTDDLPSERNTRSSQVTAEEDPDPEKHLSCGSTLTFN